VTGFRAMNRLRQPLLVFLERCPLPHVFSTKMASLVMKHLTLPSLASTSGAPEMMTIDCLAGASCKSLVRPGPADWSWHLSAGSVAETYSGREGGADSVGLCSTATEPSGIDRTNQLGLVDPRRFCDAVS